MCFVLKQILQFWTRLEPTTHCNRGVANYFTSIESSVFKTYNKMEKDEQIIVDYNLNDQEYQGYRSQNYLTKDVGQNLVIATTFVDVNYEFGSLTCPNLDTKAHCSC